MGGGHTQSIWIFFLWGAAVESRSLKRNTVFYLWNSMNIFILMRDPNLWTLFQVYSISSNIRTRTQAETHYTPSFLVSVDILLRWRQGQLGRLTARLWKPGWDWKTFAFIYWNPMGFFRELFLVAFAVKNFGGIFLMLSDLWCSSSNLTDLEPVICLEICFPNRKMFEPRPKCREILIRRFCGRSWGIQIEQKQIQESLIFLLMDKSSI